MEAILTSGGEDHLIQGLAFKPPSQTANYVLETRQVLFHAESGNKFDPQSSRVIRFRLADQGFLESSSVKLGFTLNNTAGKTMTPIGQTMSLFRRARIFCSSQLIEDRVELATEAALTDRMQEPNRRTNNSIEQHPFDANFSRVYQNLLTAKSRRLMTTTCFGLLNQEKWLPLHLISGGLVLEFELDDADT